MADRDLLHKPMPSIASEGGAKPTADRPAPVPQVGKLGVLERAREVGHEGEAPPITGRAPNKGARAPEAPKQGAAPQRKPAAAQGRPAGAAEQAGQDAPKAYKAAYFNKDSVAQINQRSRTLAALRGEEGATDLRKVVLPAPAQAGQPSPEQLESALWRMVDDAHGLPELAGLLGRQAAWTRREGVTADMVAALQAKLEALVALRKQALARMRTLPPSHVDNAPTLSQALLAGTAVAEAPDPEAEAEALVQGTARRGAGMHRRLAKVMGSKRG